MPCETGRRAARRHRRSRREIESRVAAGRDRFDAEEDLQIVLVHLVQIVGEAASRVSDDVRDRYPHTPWRQIVGMRNRVVHDYFEVDLDILWFVVTVDMPKLADQVRAILAHLESTGDGVSS